MKTLFVALSLTALVNVSCAVQPLERCSRWTTQVNGLDLQASRAWTHDGTDNESWGLMTVLVNLSQQNTVTRVDLTCTGSDDGNTTDFALQDCAISAGACTSSDATWQKTVAAADQWVWRVDLLGLPDWECTMSVGAGSGTSTDVITVKTRVCTGD